MRCGRVVRSGDGAGDGAHDGAGGGSPFEGDARSTMCGRWRAVCGHLAERDGPCVEGEDGRRVRGGRAESDGDHRDEIGACHVSSAWNVSNGGVVLTKPEPAGPTGDRGADLRRAAGGGARCGVSRPRQATGSARGGWVWVGTRGLSRRGCAVLDGRATARCPVAARAAEARWAGVRSHPSSSEASARWERRSRSRGGSCSQRAR